MNTYDMVNTASSSGIDWLFIGIIAGCVVLGVIVGIFIGRMAMKKKDI